MTNKKTITLFERYVAAEIGIEFKACLYFFCILFFYSVFRIVNGSLEASILHMAEMILSTYAMGYFQLYLLSDFDEGEKIGIRELCYIFLCTGIYTGISFLGNWYDRKPLATGLFALYLILAYVCAYLAYKWKREIDEKILNEDLKAFQDRKEL